MPKNISDYFFHLPTLIIIALLCMVLIVQLYDVGVVLGDGYLRVGTNQGELSIYWVHGCCDIDW